MALLYESMHRAMDDNGVPMPFAELYTRDPTATTTPKATYSDPDLDVSHLNTNPMVADAAGYFGPIYAGSDEQFYLILTVADGDPNAPYKTYPDVTALGGDGGTSFDRTFASARLKITSGEVDTGINGILIQTGPSSPDETGGAVLMQGQAGAQGELAVLDYAETRVTGTLETTGNATVGGILNVTGVSPFYTKLSSGTVTAEASVEIPLPSTYDAYIIRLAKFSNTNSATLSAVLSFAASYKTASGDYTTCLNHAVAGTYSATTGVSSYIPLSTSGVSLYGNAVLNLFSTAGQESVIDGQVSLMRAAGAAMTAWPTAATDAKSYGKADEIRLEVGAGTMTCEWALFGVPGL